MGDPLLHLCMRAHRSPASIFPVSADFTLSTCLATACLHLLRAPAYPLHVHFTDLWLCAFTTRLRYPWGCRSSVCPEFTAAPARCFSQKRSVIIVQMVRGSRRYLSTCASVCVTNASYRVVLKKRCKCMLWLPLLARSVLPRSHETAS